MRKTFVHRYKWSHHNRRRQFRRAAKQGIVRLLEESKDGWLYEIPEGFNPSPIR